MASRATKDFESPTRPASMASRATKDFESPTRPASMAMLHGFACDELIASFTRQASDSMASRVTKGFELPSMRPNLALCVSLAKVIQIYLFLILYVEVHGWSRVQGLSE